jgi:DNA-binding transcriptional MocR family regulator
MTKQFDRAAHKYEELAAQLVGLIEGGAFSIGERVPSVRELGRRLKTSPATVFAAYGELERRGWIEARPQSGFYVRRTKERVLSEPAPTEPADDAATAVTTAELTRRLIEPGERPTLALDVAAPAPELIPHVALARALARAVRLRPALASMYSKPPGHLSLRKAIAQRALGWGGDPSPRDVVITTGATEAIHLCLRTVAKAGDVIAVESPTYYGVLQSIESLGMRALELPTTPQTGIRLDRLARALKRHRIAACFAMPNFANPLGGLMPDEAKRELVRMLARARVPLIEDDVAGDLPFDGSRPRTAQSFDEHGLVLLCSSVSKMLSSGVRIGWVVSPRFRDRILVDQWTTTGAVSTPAQLAIAELMQSRTFERHLRQLRARLRRTVLAMSDAIERHFGPGVTLTRPRGGLVLWISLPRGVDSMLLQRRALADGIAIMPGILFSPRPVYRNCIRLNCGLPFTPEVDRAMARLGKRIGELRA